MRNRFNSGFFTLGVLGLFYVWKNRFQVQKLLSSYGIDLPIKATSDGSLVDNVRSATAKVVGKVEHTSDRMDRQASSY